MDVGRSKGEELGWVSDDSPDSEGDPTRVLASRLRIRTYPSGLTSNHEFHLLVSDVNSICANKSRRL
jgi:hypothetical protein